MSFYFPTFTTVPDFQTAPKYGITSEHSALRIAFGTARIAFPSTQPDHVFAFGFSFDTAAEIRALKRFFLDRGGRAHPFYLPTWRNDLPAVSGTAGTLALTVEAEDYEANHLTEPATRPDHYGRQIFVWQPGQDLWAERVIRATDAGSGNTTLDMETPLPFTIDPATAIVGYCHLARFLEDRIDWTHLSDTAATTEIKFRGIRQHILNEQTNPITDLDYHGSLGFVSVTQEPIATSPLDNRTAYASGPMNLHYSQDEIYFTRWACWVNNGKPSLKRLASGDITLPDTSGTASLLFPTETVATDHISLAFDQNGWEVIAYQATPTTIALRRFFNLAIDTRGWTGTDPVLVFNQLLDPNLADGDSDVCCYYFKPGDNTLYVRFQREDFETENVSARLPLRPLAIKRTWIASQIHYLEMLDAGFRSAILQTDTYPAPPTPTPPNEIPINAEDAGTAVLTATAAYLASIVYADGLDYAEAHPEFSDAGSAVLTATATYSIATVTEELPAEAGTAVLTATAVYSQQVISADAMSDAGSAVLTTASASYTLSAVEPPESTDAATAILTATATYEPA